MKFITMLLLASSLLTGTAKAQSDNDNALSSTAASLGAYGIMSLRGCADPELMEVLPGDQMSMTREVRCIAGGMATTIALLNVLTLTADHKMEIDQVKSEAILFLAGEVMTDELTEQVEKLKAFSQELAKLTDEELVSIIASLK